MCIISKPKERSAASVIAIYSALENTCYYIYVLFTLRISIGFNIGCECSSNEEAKRSEYNVFIIWVSAILYIL